VVAVGEYLKDNNYVLMQGSEALVRGAIHAGVRFFAGYPITPATEITEHMARLLPRNESVFFQGEDELACINAIIGASWAGLKSMTATSGPGFSLVQEGIGYAAVTETPIVIVDVMRGGPSTGQPTLPAQQDVMQAKFGSHGDYEIIALAPASVREMFTMTVEAVNLSEKYRTPVIVLTDEIIAHLWEKVRLPGSWELQIIERKKPKGDPRSYETFQETPDLVPPMARLGDGYAVLVEGQLHDEHGYGVGNDPAKSAKNVTRIVEKITRDGDALARMETCCMEDDPEAVVVSYGSTSRSARDAVDILRSRGVKIGYLRLITLWPFAEGAIRKQLGNAKRIFFPEMNMGKYSQYLRILGTDVIALPKIGGVMHSPSEIASAIEARWT
jgi:2-oxoglutarate ferredoxin oxidoreductase subunit alpha